MYLNIYQNYYQIIEENTTNAYINHNSFFDISINNGIDNLIQVNNPKDLRHFIYDRVIFNSIDYIIKGKLIELLNSIGTPINKIMLFVHNDISNYKREDISLILDRLKDIKVVNFIPANNKFFKNNLTYNIPSTKITDISKSQYKKNILVLNNNNYNLNKISICNKLKSENCEILSNDSLKNFYPNHIDVLHNFDTIVYTENYDRLYLMSLGLRPISIYSLIINDQDYQDQTIYNQNDDCIQNIKKLLQI